MRRLGFRPQARLEIAEEADWYEKQGVRLGAEFLRAVDVALSSIRRNPEQYQDIRGRMRRTVLRRFPYSIICLLSDEEVIVVGCVHGKRDPRRWQRRT